MRAILLVKDKEGVNEDRLKGRYGLTGKATISKEGVAGALGTSFKAGQQITLNNLRSLGNKINEAQKALNNASHNINETDRVQDTIEDTVNKINNRLNVGIWEYLWNGSRSPFDFFVSKYQEDIANEAYAGEPCHSVIGIDKNKSTAPIPRTPYWDPLLVYGELADNDIGTSFRLIAPKVLERFEDDQASLNAKFYATIGVLSTVTSAMFLASSLDPAIGAKFYSTSVVLTTFAAGLVVMYVFFTRAVRYLINSETKALIVKNYGGGFPVMYNTGIFGQLKYTLHSLFNDTITDLLILATTASVLWGGVVAMEFISMGLMTNPFTLAAGLAVKAAAIGVAYGTLILICQISLDMFKLALTLTTNQTTVTTCNLDSPIPRNSFLLRLLGANWISQLAIGFHDTYSPIFKEASGLEHASSSYRSISIESDFDKVNDETQDFSLIAGYPGCTLQFKFGVTVDAIGQLLIGTNIIFGITNIVGLIKSAIFDTDQFPDTSDVPMTTTKINANRSEVRLGDSNLTDSGLTWPLQDWFGLSTFNIGAQNQINDVVSGSVNNVTFPAGDIMCSEIRMCSEVFDGNYFRKKWTTKTIDKTIIIKSKAEIHHNADSQPGLWYGCMALVRFAGESKLYLLWERNAIYFKNYHIKHIEQMIYNIPMNSSELPASKMFTEDRRGQLQYFYVEDEPGDGNTYVIQFRPIKSQQTNYLNNEAVNTEYVFNGNVNLTTSPMNGQIEGGVLSYCSKG